MEESDSTEEGTDIRPADKDKCAEKTAQLGYMNSAKIQAVNSYKYDEDGRWEKIRI